MTEGNWFYRVKGTQEWKPFYGFKEDTGESKFPSRSEDLEFMEED